MPLKKDCVVPGVRNQKIPRFRGRFVAGFGRGKDQRKTLKLLRVDPSLMLQIPFSDRVSIG